MRYVSGTCKTIKFDLDVKYSDMFRALQNCSRYAGVLTPRSYFMQALERDRAEYPEFRDLCVRGRTTAISADEAKAEFDMNQEQLRQADALLESGNVRNRPILVEWADMPYRERMLWNKLEIAAKIGLNLHLERDEMNESSRLKTLYEYLKLACHMLDIPLDEKDAQQPARAGTKRDVFAEMSDEIDAACNPRKHSKIADELDAILSGDTLTVHDVADSNALEKAKADIAAGNMRNLHILKAWSNQLRMYGDKEACMSDVAFQVLGYRRVDPNGREDVLRELLMLACESQDYDVCCHYDEEDAADWAVQQAEWRRKNGYKED